MSSPISMTVSRREAAVAAALAGTVVVVLGYASGLGLQVDTPFVAPQPAQPAPPAVPEQAVPAMDMAAVPGAAAMPPMGGTPGDHSSHPQPGDPTSEPTSTPTSEPTTDPTSEPTTAPTTEPTMDPTTVPTDPSATCAPSQLEQVPVVGPAVTPVTTVLVEFLGAAPVVGGVVAPPTSEEDEHRSLSCLLGAAAGPPCCASAASDQADAGP